MTTPATDTSTPALGSTIASLLQIPMHVAAALTGVLTNPATLQAATGAASSLLKGAYSSSSSSCGCGGACGGGRSSYASGCEIPPPCWEPRPVGCCNLQLAPGGTATIRVHVTNCAWTRQQVVVTAPGKLAGWFTYAPTTLLLTPQERATFFVTVRAPTNATVGAHLSTPLLIRGCLNHFARVEVTICDCAPAGANCCDVCVNDCADQIHHWYDHFYCPRPCSNTVTTVPGDTVPGRLLNG